MIISRQKIFFDYSRFEVKDAEVLKKLRSAKAKEIMARRSRFKDSFNNINKSNKEVKKLIESIDWELKFNKTKSNGVYVDKDLANEIIERTRKAGETALKDDTLNSFNERWRRREEILKQIEKHTNDNPNKKLSRDQVTKLLKDVNSREANRQIRILHNSTKSRQYDERIDELMWKRRPYPINKKPEIKKVPENIEVTKKPISSPSTRVGGSSSSVTYISPSRKTKAINRTHKNLSRSFGRNSKLAAAGALGLGLVGGGYYALKD